jgi:hypothetical protein
LKEFGVEGRLTGFSPSFPTSNIATRFLTDMDDILDGVTLLISYLLVIWCVGLPARRGTSANFYTWGREMAIVKKNEATSIPTRTDTNGSGKHLPYENELGGQHITYKYEINYSSTYIRNK